MYHGMGSGLEEGELWVIEEKRTALYCVWFSFRVRLIVLVVGAAVENKKTSVKRKKIECLGFLDLLWHDEILQDLLP